MKCIVNYITISKLLFKNIVKTKDLIIVVRLFSIESNHVLLK